MARRQRAGWPADTSAAPPGLLERVRAGADAYLRWGHDTLGWAIYLFRVAA